jgi:exodeoxyribonuclease V alpha subunit
MESISGYIKGVLYHNEASNYYVVKVELDQKKDEVVTVTGYFESIKKDELYRFYGEYKDHPRFGMQFNFESYEKILPNGEEAIIRFLSSSLFPKIGVKTAERIYSLLGDNALTYIKQDIKCLDPLNLKPEQVKSIQDGLNNGTRLEEAMKIFIGHGLNMKTLIKLDAIYKEDMVKIILNNPYQMIKDVDGINFKSADKIASSLGIEKNDERRIKAGIIYLANQICYKTQSTYTNYDALYKEANKLFDELTYDTFDMNFNALLANNDLYQEEDRIYPYDLYEAEIGIANYLKPYITRKISHIDHFEILEAISELEKSNGINYSKEQKDAIIMALTSGISIVSGGPGTGKTTVVNAIIKVYEKLFKNSIITLTAPTGRAAKRMSELTNMTATTIHRLLGWNLDNNVFSHDEDDPINGDLLIVDEFSMVDAVLFYHLLKGTHPFKQLVLIGDEQQLPPVNTGDTLHELLDLDFIPRLILVKIHRQEATSGIIPLAYDIRSGMLNPENLKKDDVAFISCSNYEIKDLVVYFATKAMERGYSQQDIQVLAPMYDGVAGINGLNVVLQQVFNPKSLTKKEHQVGRVIYREGDKILQLKNQPDDDVYNGDIGILEEIITKEEDENGELRFIVNFDGNLVEYTADNFINITHAYCVSVHKSQGSEYPIVIFPIVYDYRIMLKRKLIYTAITRTKKSLVLLGDIRALNYAINNDSFDLINTTLKKRIKENLGY